jgi:hypothetical protein
MVREAPFERLGRELEAAAERQAAATRQPAERRSGAGGPRRAHWRRRTLALAIAAACAAAAAASWAASTLLSTGSPVPYQRGAPIAGVAQGAPIPGTVKLLADNVPDPAGAPPWGLRYWETDRKYACVQVGRIYEGKIGQITGGKVFHELPLGVAELALGGCYALDGGGHAFVALHTDARGGGQPSTCPPPFQGGNLRPRVRCVTPNRTVDFGLLGPNAKSFTYRAAGQVHTAAPLGGVGGYLVVQKHIKPVIREFGFHHRDPKLNLRGPAEPYIGLTPGSQVIGRVVYTRGTCTVRITLDPYGACNAQAGFVPIPQPHVGDVRAPIRAFAAPNGRGIRVRFRARQAVTDGRSGYDIEVHPPRGRGFETQTYEHNVAAGDLVRTTVDLYNRQRGTYRIVVRYRTVDARPGPYASLAYPGLLVGVQRVDVP